MTIKDVARRAGYAVGTVSRVLNGSPAVSEEARAKILTVVAETGFQPNHNARHLKRRGSSSLYILVKGVCNPFFAAILEKMQQQIRLEKQTAVVCCLDENEDEVKQGIQLCREIRPMGLLFLGGQRDHFLGRFERITCPSVLVTARADTLNYPNLSSVSTDDVEGAAQAAQYLLCAGHRYMGVIGGEASGRNISQLRLAGWMHVLRREGISFCLTRQFQAARFLSMAEGYMAATDLLDRCPGLTAIFALSDVLALGAMRAIQDRGLRVPEDISLMGYDGIDLAEYCVPRLATVRQPIDWLAQRSVSILLHQVAGGGAVHEVLPFEIVAGESVQMRG